MNEAQETEQENATKVIYLTPKTKARFIWVNARDEADATASQFQNKLLDLWETAKRQEETGED